MTTTAKIILDSINFDGARITTFEVEAPRFLLAEVNTHRVIAKSAASSRAIPVEKRIAMVKENPFVPKAFGKNKRGMQAEETLEQDAAEYAESTWRAAAESATIHAQGLVDAGVHKQQANRILEPFVYYHGVMTATEWDNFWHLRLHPDAQPEFQELAGIMKELYDASKPQLRKYHLPYADDLADDYEVGFKVSAARCARVSYRTFDGNISTVIKDMELCEQLISAGHMSPFDHAATSDTSSVFDMSKTLDDPALLLRYWDNPGDHRHLWGWIPYRVEIEREREWTCRRDSYAPLP